MKFHPPVESRSNEELIGIAYSTTEFWQQEIIIYARKELERRGVSKEYETALLDKWAQEIKQSESDHRKWLSENAFEQYALHDKLLIILLSPFILLGKWNYGTSLSELKADNYKLKYKQRRVFLLLGVILWVVFFYVITQIGQD